MDRRVLERVRHLEVVERAVSRASHSNVLQRLLYARRLVEARATTGYRMAYPPGHYYSPIPALKDVRRREAEIFAKPETLPGIDLRVSDQLELVATLGEASRGHTFAARRRANERYYFENEFFNLSDAVVLHAMLRWLRPRRLVEVGSGFSSAVILDADDQFLSGELACTFVDPFPKRLMSLLTGSDRERHLVVDKPVQDVPLETFQTLERDDVLFIDSSHVAKVGGDVNYLLFEVLPSLREGVVVHVHDIGYPFEYFRDWVYAGRAWNESYLLRAFLMFNSDFSVLVFNAFLASFHSAEVEKHLPQWDGRGGSIWLRREKRATG